MSLIDVARSEARASRLPRYLLITERLPLFDGHVRRFAQLSTFTSRRVRVAPLQQSQQTMDNDCENRHGIYMDRGLWDTRSTTSHQQSSNA
eukprot:1870574-Pleurochrysis_carterae.AAC.8